MGRDEDGLLLLMRKVFEQEQNLDSVLQRLSILEKRLEELPEDLGNLAFLSALQTRFQGAGFGNDGSGMPGDVSGGSSGMDTAGAREPAQTVMLSKAQYEDLMLVRGEWQKLIRMVSGAGRAALKNTVVEPAGDSCLCVVCADSGIFSVVKNSKDSKSNTKIIQKQKGKYNTQVGIQNNYEGGDK